MTLIILALGLLLAVVTRQWLVLRARERQRGILRRWPIPRAPVEQLDPVFRPDELGATLAVEVEFVGRGTIAVPGGTTDTEAWILAVLAKRARRMFEFGTCTGKTSYMWARNLPEGGTVTTLTLAPGQAEASRHTGEDDPEAVRYAKAESRFTRFLYSGTGVEDRITQLYGDSKAFDDAPHAGAHDVIFVDGSHAYSYVVSDTAKALRMICPGGLVLWHDYSPECPGVFRALNELATRLPLILLQGTTLVAYRRPASDLESVPRNRQPPEGKQ